VAGHPRGARAATREVGNTLQLFNQAPAPVYPPPGISYLAHDPPR